MNRTIRLLVITICMLSYVQVINSQQVIYFSLQDALNIASENNQSIRISEIEQRIASANYHQTDAAFLPKVTMGYSAITTNNPLNAFGFLLQQRSVSSSDFDPSRLNYPGSSQNYSASAEVLMPLFNADLIYARKGAKYQVDMYRYKKQYMQDYIRFEVQNAYTQLQFAYQTRNILISTLNDVKSIFNIVNDFYSQGLVHKSDLLNAQVQVNTIESALSKAESNINNTSDALRFLMNMKQAEEDVTIRTDSLIQLLPTDFMPVFSVMRSDIIAMNKALQASEAMVKSSRMSFIPRINAFVNYQFNDARIFRFQQDSYMAGINLSWDIFNGNRNRSKLRSTILQRDKLKKELDEYTDKSRMEVDKTNRELKDLLIEINKQQSSVDQASEALRILLNRYKEGLVSTTDILASQAQLSQQKLGLAQSVMTYNITRFYQELLTNIKE